MGFFEKLTRFFRSAPPQAPAEASPTAPASGSTPAAPAPFATPAPNNGNQKPPRDQFLDELRAIPTNRSPVEAARLDMLKELKRLASPGHQGPP